MNYRIETVYETKAGISVEIACIEENSPADVNDAENNRSFLFKPSFWLEEQLSKGDTIDEARVSSLAETAELCRAVARAESMLAQSDYSRQRLITRLLHYDLDKKTCEAAADYMVENGFINEVEQTKRITKFYCVRKHWGKKRIAAELLGRGYDRKVIFSALDTVSADDYYNSLIKLINEKYRTPSADRHEKELRVAALSRMGFSLDEIFRALDESDAMMLEAEEL